MSHHLFGNSVKLSDLENGCGLLSGPSTAINRGIPLDLAALATAYRITIASKPTRAVYKQYQALDPMVVEWIKHGFWVDPRRSFRPNKQGILLPRAALPISPIKVVSRGSAAPLDPVWYPSPATYQCKQFGEQFERELMTLLWGPLCNLYTLLSAHSVVDRDVNCIDSMTLVSQFPLTKNIHGRELFQWLRSVPKLWKEDQEWVTALVQGHNERLEKHWAEEPEMLSIYKAYMARAEQERFYLTIYWTPPSTYVTTSSRVPTMPKSAKQLPKSTLRCMERIWEKVFAHCNAVWDAEVQEMNEIESAMDIPWSRSRQIRVFCAPPSH